MLALIIQLLSGAVGGNAAGAAMKSSSMGTLWNSVAGIAGGGLGGQVLVIIAPSLGAATASGATDLTSILGSIASGSVGGGILMLVVSMIKKTMAK
jgi:uncharacterized membrane protein YeaQ/YmgE (transglycosylase-associated protein family)